MTRPTALVISSYCPFPVTSGGRKRLVRLLEAMERTGAAPYILTLDDIPEGISEARDRGWRVEVFARPGGSFKGRLLQHLRHFPVPYSEALARTACELARASAFVELEEIESIQYLDAVRRIAPVAVSMYNIDSQVRGEIAGGGVRSTYHRRRMAQAERRAARRADALFCVSQKDRDYFAAFGKRNTVLVPNGVDDDLFEIPLGPVAGDRVFFFGSFGWAPNAEGVRRFVEGGWSRVVSARPQAQLRVAGPGSREALGHLASRKHGIEVLGFLEDLPRELASAAVVVAPLWTGGGTRLKVLEALAAGRPIAGTSVAVEQIGFEHERHGLIANAPDALGKAVAELLTDRTRAARLAAGGRELAERFRWTTVTRPAEALYSRWVEERLSAGAAQSPPGSRPSAPSAPTGT